MEEEEKKEEEMIEFGEAMEEMTDGDFKSKDASVVGEGGMEVRGGGGGG